MASRLNRSVGRLLCRCFGHVWTDKGLPSPRGIVRQRCEGCGEERTVYIYGYREERIGGTDGK